MDAGKIATIELNMDSKEKKDKKQREPGKLKSFLQAYGKYVGAGAVALALVIVCAVSLADRIANREVATGVMMTVADLTKDKEPFSGDLFASTAISYNDMVNVNYETDQLAQLERAEQQIDEILTLASTIRMPSLWHPQRPIQQLLRQPLPHRRMYQPMRTESISIWVNTC